MGTLNYSFPSKLDRNYVDCLWFCLSLFNTFPVESVERLISAVMLETSIVFVGRQDTVSSAILGLNSLLYPFKWCLALVPILPH
jgi:hypothetical protein